MSILVAASISWGQQAKRNDLQTFGSLYLIELVSPKTKQMKQFSKKGDGDIRDLEGQFL